MFLIDPKNGQGELTTPESQALIFGLIFYVHIYIYIYGYFYPTSVGNKIRHRVSFLKVQFNMFDFRVFRIDLLTHQD